MDTKLKNKEYKIVNRVILSMILFFLIFSFGLSSLYYLDNYKYVNNGFSEKNFYTTSAFKNSARRIFTYIIRDNNTRNLAKNLEVTAYDKKGEVIKELSTNDRKIDDYVDGVFSFKFERQENSEIFQKYLDKKAEFKKLKSLEKLDEKQIKELAQLEKDLKKLNQRDDIHNERIGFINYESSIKFHKDLGYFYIDANDDNIAYKYYITFSDDDSSDTLLGNEKAKYNKFKEMSVYLLSYIIISFILGIIIAIYLFFITGKTSKDSDIKLNYFDNIPIEIFTVFCLAFIVIFFGEFLNNMSLNHFSIDFMYVVVCMIIAAFMYIGFEFLLSLARSIKNHTFKNRFLIYNIFGYIKEMLKLDKKNTKRILLYLSFAFIFLLMLVLLIGDTDLSSIIVVMILFTVVVLIARYVIVHNLSVFKMNKYVNDVVSGKKENDLNIDKLLPTFEKLSDNILAMNKIRKDAVDSSLKNEKMKTELITNITHDLKTPLTSIISYSDLLSKEKIENETAVKYIRIIAEKSNRLKELIDHLVEVSKVDSGITNINIEKINLVSLIKQFEGEYDGELKSKGLNLIINSLTNDVYIETDSVYYSRMLDNIFSNIVKYSMPNTRVFCDIYENGMLCIKNISEEKIDLTEEELQKRFVRGDKARSTEGNGLGLSITKSIAASLGLDFVVSIDGDLFKVCISKTI